MTSEKSKKPPTSICSAGDSPVRICPSPGNEGVCKQIAPVCGSNISGLFAWFDRDTYSWRTFQACLVTGWTPYSQTWPRAGMMRNGIVYRHRISAYHISGNESGYLPTPQASDGLFYMIKREVYLRGKNYRILSNQGIDGNAKMADVAWKMWGGPLNPQYVEAMMGYPINHTDLNHSETLSSPKSSNGSENG